MDNFGHFKHFPLNNSLSIGFSTISPSYCINNFNSNNYEEAQEEETSAGISSAAALEPRALADHDISTEAALSTAPYAEISTADYGEYASLRCDMFVFMDASVTAQLAQQMLFVIRYFEDF